MSEGDRDEERKPEWFADYASKLFGLDRGEWVPVIEESRQRGVPPYEVAVQKRLITSAQSEIVAPLFKPRATLADYEFQRVLGQGAMGVVYEARQLSLDRPVAIKTILLGKTSTEARFEVEARTIARLRHPNIMTAFDLQTRDGRLYLILELLDGENLEDYMTDRGRLSEFLTWHIIRQAANALSYAQSQNIVHRDIKPANLFLVPAISGFSLPDGVPMVKVTDFGLARLAERELGETQLTQEGRILGTPAYMAPEQLSSPMVDHRADLYSLGATAYQMLSGSPPFSDLPFTTLITRKTIAEPDRLDSRKDGVPERSADLIAQLLRRHAEQRLGSYQELIDRIDQLLLESSASVMSTSAAVETHHEITATLDIEVHTRPAHKVPQRRRTMTGVALAGFALMAVVIGSVLVGTFRSQSPAVQTSMRRTGVSESLFDGRSITGWRTYGGGANPTVDGEGGSVLEITGEVRRGLPRYQWFELNVGVDLSDADRLTVTLSDATSAAVAVSVSAMEIIVIHFDIEDGATTNPRVLEQRSLAGNPWHGASPETPVYRHLRIVREPERWAISFHTDTEVAVPSQGEAKPKELVLISEGVSRLEAPRIDEMEIDGPA